MSYEQCIYRGYYTAVRRYEFYLRVVKTIFYERAQRVSKILFSPREDKIHILKPPCNVLFIVVNNLRPKSVILIIDYNAKNMALFQYYLN